MIVKRNSRRIIAFIVAIIMVFSLVDYREHLKVYGTPSGESTQSVTKTATVEGNEEERIYKLSFTANMNRVLVENKEKFPIDVILLIDMSTSMYQEVVGTDKSRLEVMKDVAEEFVDKLADYSKDSTLSIATYCYTSDILIEPVQVNSEENKNTLKNKIKGIYIDDNQPGGTNHDYGFMQAKKILTDSLSESTNQKYIILLTDGAPNQENRDEALDKDLYPELTNGNPVRYFDFTTETYQEGVFDKISSRTILRDLGVVSMLNGIKVLEPTIKVATVGFETKYIDKESDQKHIDALFDLVTGIDLETGVTSEGAGGESYQFYTDTSTSLASIFNDLMNNFAEENSEFQEPIIIDYIEAGFEPLNDDGEPITVEQARSGYALDNGAVIRYDDEKGLYYVVWAFDWENDREVIINTEWTSEVYIKAKNNLVGGEDIATNTEDSGVYVDNILVEEFPVPTVDVYVRKYDITYTFKSGTDGRTLPSEVTALLPGTQEDVNDGSTINPKMPTQVEVVDGDGRWIFRTWDATEKTISGADIEFEGTWEYIPNPSYDVSHSFVSGTDGKVLPQEVLDLVPADQLGILDGTTVTPTVLTTTEVYVEGGKWKFTSWDEPSKVIASDNQYFEGTWEYIDVYDVTHTFTSETIGKTLPQGVIDLLPAPQEKVEDGSTVTPGDVTLTEFGEESGKWTFTGWDQPSKVIEGANQNFEGKWKFTIYTYDVDYTFKSGTDGKTLPQDVIDLLPGKHEDVEHGTTVIPTEITQTEVYVEDGKWKFTSWDEPSKVITGTDNSFEGTWEYIATYDVTHTFTSETTGKTLPQGVMDLLPAPQEKVEDGTTVTPGAVTTTEFSVDGGKWTFTGWDQSSKVIECADQNFEGKWKFTPHKYDVGHTFVSGTDGKELPQEVMDLLPSSQEGIEYGTTVRPTELKQTEVKVEGGKWIFKTWDEDEKRITNDDQKFVGTWEYIVTYEVIYNFESGTDGKPLPQEVIDLIPEKQTHIDKGSKVTPPDLKETEVYVEGGKWTFEDWDDKEKTISEENESFVGTWKYTAKYKLTYSFESGTEGKELPKEILDLLPSDKKHLDDGSIITPEKLASMEILVDDGKWVFKFWDAEQKKINGANEEFVGTWVFISTVPEVPEEQDTSEVPEETEETDEPDTPEESEESDESDIPEESEEPEEPEEPSNLVSPSTGDSVNANVWYAVLLVSLLVVVCMVLMKNASKKVNK